MLGLSSDVPAIAIEACAARTCFGDLSTTWEKLLAGQSIDDHAKLECDGDSPRAMSLARAVAAEVVSRVGEVDSDTAVVVGTSKGTVEDWFQKGPRPAGLADIAAVIAQDHGTSGPVLTLSAACASGLHALIRATMMIRAGEIKRALVVAAEASVHPLFVGSFQRLGILATPGAGCRPFDRNRCGFYVSEAACAVMLGTDADAPVKIDRFALAGDATHITGNDPRGLVLRRVLHDVIAGEDVDLVHAHGTGTESNDAVELAAIEDAVCESASKNPIVYSHKAALGHSLGASGLLSVVLSCLAHTTGVIPPNVRTTDPLPAGGLSIPSTVKRRPVRRSVTLAAGFGGPLAAVSLVSK
jgi:3-oxoacyl-[acyl-carrier-protein] synthase II